jgi:hypothetical protein
MYESNSEHLPIVLAGLDPAIHVAQVTAFKTCVDARHKAGHYEVE